MEFEHDDLQPRSVPTRSPFVPSFCKPSVPEVSLMLGNAQWSSQNLSRIESACASRISRFQENMFCSGNNSPKAYQNSTSPMPDSHNHLSQTSNSPAFQTKVQQLNDIYYKPSKRIEPEHRSQGNNQLTERCDKFQNQHHLYQGRRDSYGLCNNSVRPVCLSNQQNKKQDTESSQKQVNENAREHYEGWKSYFKGQASSLQYTSPSSVHPDDCVRHPERELGSSKMITSSHQESVTYMTNNHAPNENSLPISEQQLKNIIVKIITDFKNASDLQCENKFLSSASHVEANSLYNGNRQNMSPPSQNRNIPDNSNFELVEERQLQRISVSKDQTSDSTTSKEKKNRIHSREVNTKRTDIQSMVEDKNVTVQEHDNSVTLTQLHTLVQSQADQLIALQEKLDKILLMQEVNFRNNKRSCVSSREQVKGSCSKERDVTTIDVSTQTSENFYREIGVGTEPRETASVGIMTVAPDSPVPFDRDNTFSSHKRQQVYNMGTYEQLNNEESVAEETHPDESICLNGIDLPSLQVQVPSPMPSIHVDMQDFEEDEDNNSVHSSHSDEEHKHNETKAGQAEPGRVGWTFYNQVVEQVNKLLEDRAAERGQNYDLKNARNRTNTVNKTDVRNATLEHLRKLGISFFDEGKQVDDTNNVKKVDSVQYPRLQAMPCDNQTGESDRSVQINALAMKYLKEDYREAKVCNVSMKTSFSMSTLRYLERYHLLAPNHEGETNGMSPNNMGCQAQPRRPAADTGSPNIQRDNNVDKILDITTIKNQPKLL